MHLQLSEQLSAASSTMTWGGVDWLSFLIVLLVATAITTTVTSLYALGLRLWASSVVTARGEANLLARTASVLCFTVCVAIVLFALWLIVPQFH